MGNTVPKYLFHTTSVRGALETLQERRVEGWVEYVSFSEVPLFSATPAQPEVVLAFRGDALVDQIEQGIYEEWWFDQHEEKAVHLAEAGWEDPILSSDEYVQLKLAVDEDGNRTEADEARMEAALRAAALAAFLRKAADREWVSQEPDAPVRVTPSSVAFVLVRDPRVLDAVTAVLDSARLPNLEVRIAGEGSSSGDLSDRAAGILFTDGGRILLLRRSLLVDDGGTWSLPGGYCKEADKGFADTAARECEEEVGSIPPNKVLDTYTIEFPKEGGGTFVYVTHVCEVTPAVVEGFIATLDEESDSWGWFTEEEVQSLKLHPGLERLLTHTDPFYGERQQHITASTTLEELQQLPTSVLDRQAFGVEEGVQRLAIEKIDVVYDTDYENAMADVEDGTFPLEESVLEEPVDVALSSGIYRLEDGHHRLIVARKLGHHDILVDLVIKDNPVKVLAERLGITAAAMPEPTEEMIRNYEERTQRHIDMVRKWILLLEPRGSFTAEELAERGSQHDADKYSPEKRVPYIWVTEYYRLKNAGEDIPAEVQEAYDASREATGDHVSINRHHPEAHDGPNAMTEMDVAEMVADWSAMAEELGEGSARGWADKNVGTKWKFDKEHVEMIDYDRSAHRQPDSVRDR